jgi:hypothetical protein
MKSIVKVIVLTICVFITTPVFSGSPASELGGCLVESLNGKERKELAKWIFFAMAAHPEMKSYSSASDKDIQQTDEFVGKLITRLLTENCPRDLQKAYKADPSTIQKAFELVGKVAMRELMTDQNVTKSISNYVRYIDEEKINKVLLEK